MWLRGAIAVLLGVLTRPGWCICPLGCSCSTDGRRAVRCDGIPLGDVPSLLDPRTRTLSVCNASLTRLDPDLMELYPDLEFFDASLNNVENLDVGAFKFQSKLRVLLLSGNKISAVRRGNFAGLTKLQMLDLSNNSIEYVDSSSLQDASSLVELKLTGNQLGPLHPAIFSGLSHLRKLDLSANRIVRLDADVLRPLKSLETLDLSDNLISTIMPMAYASQGSLKRLNLASNSIETLGETSMNGLKTLRHLNLSNNLIRQLLSSSFRPLSSLHELDVSWNAFSELTTSSFDGLTSLHHLDVTHERHLRIIHMNAFSGLPNLHLLNLSACSSLEIVDENAFEHAGRLKILDVSNGRLSRIPPNLVRWNTLEFLDLSGNPLHCDCELQSFLPAVMRSLYSDALCITPPHYASQRVTDLPSLCSHWSESEISVLLVAGVLALATVLLLGTLFVCARRRASRTPFYERSFLTTSSVAYDKSDLLSNHTFYSASQRSDDLPPQKAAANLDFADDGNYSTVGLPHDDEDYPPQLYETPFGLRPVPPPETTIPSRPTTRLLDDGSVEDNFKIICEFPVPITEL